jgi:hypothetical protein
VNDHFGSSVAIDGTTVAVGAPYDNWIATDKGAAYIFSTPYDRDVDGLLDSWEIAHFGTITDQTAMDDTDGDGLINLLEEAFATDPLTPDLVAAPTAVDEGGYLTITITKNAGVTYLVQSSPTPIDADFSAATTTVLIDDPITLKVRDNVLIETSPGRFMRVKVTAAP